MKPGFFQIITGFHQMNTGFWTIFGMISIGILLKSLKALKRAFIHFIHKSPKTSKCLSAPFRPIGRGLQAKKANGLINSSCKLSQTLKEYEWYIRWELNFKYYASQACQKFRTYSTCWTRSNIQPIKQSAAAILVPGYNLIQMTL